MAKRGTVEDEMEYIQHFVFNVQYGSNFLLGLAKFSQSLATVLADYIMIQHKTYVCIYIYMYISYI